MWFDLITEDIWMSLYMLLIALYSSIHVHTHKRWSHADVLHSDVVKMSQICTECLLAVFHSLRPDTRNDGTSPCKVFFPLQHVTHNHSLTRILHITNVRREHSVSMCVDAGPLTGMEAACWTNSLTNVSTFPPPSSCPSPSLASTNWHVGTGQRDEGRRKGRKEGKKRRGVVWQAADPLALPSDSVYLPLAPWGFVSEDSAMMNRPV